MGRTFAVVTVIGHFAFSFFHFCFSHFHRLLCSASSASGHRYRAPYNFLLSVHLVAFLLSLHFRRYS
jgi:hypothetical protein